MKSAIDLYSGIGGWTLGMKLSGVENLASYEYWYEANQTHNLNFGTNHKEINIRDIDVERDLIFDNNPDFVVGSPPCTQFSYANRGGNGDIEDGLIDVYKFLEVVEFLKPKYWAMENVPRVANILEKELNEGVLMRFRSLVKVIKVVNAANYGVPQSRKRMIAGNFPIQLFDDYAHLIPKKTLGDVMSSLWSKDIIDPNYGYKLSAKKVTEMENEVELTQDEERINHDSKAFHPIYNNMSFPDRLDRPSRTVTATCTRVSRESIIIGSKNGFRRLNVRERGSVQGFPITYQFYGRTLNSKFKMIGNAVPPILTYYIFQSMLEVKPKNLVAHAESSYYHEQPSFKTYKSNLGLPSRKYPSKRKFQFAVPNLRYGSGVRFELSNNPKVEKADWSFKFYFGNSKYIQEVKLDKELKDTLAPIVNTSHNHVFNYCIDKLYEEFSAINSEELQSRWTSNNDNYDAFYFLDSVGECVNEILKTATFDNIDADLVEAITQVQNRKLCENKNSVIAGFYFLSSLNNKLFT